MISQLAVILVLNERQVITTIPKIQTILTLEQASDLKCFKVYKTSCMFYA